ncbi:MAG: hypothetical protein U0L53_07950 [Bacteroidales bacterium]|nr:hypothetical protein [Bacteroidales bacterium]
MPIRNNQRQREEIVHQDQEIVHNNNEEQFDVVQEIDVIDNEEQLDVVQEIGVQDNYEPTPEINEVDIPTSTPAPTGGIPNVNVKDTETPIIFLFGPPSAGKTMTLVRLYRYLDSIKTSIEPNESFVSNDGGEYVRRCRRFHNDAMSDLAAEATKGVNFMLLDIWNNGEKKCQILESPGERLFEPDPNKKIPFPSKYVSNIINSNNKKVYVFILEPNYKDFATRVRYKNRIAQVQKMMSRNDKVIFLYNKIDDSPALVSNGDVNMRTLIKEINQDYPGLLDLFKTPSPITKIIREYNCHLIPFQTGTYDTEFSETLNKNVKTFTAGRHRYPQELWNTIKKCL